MDEARIRQIVREELEAALAERRCAPEFRQAFQITPDIRAPQSPDWEQPAQTNTNPRLGRHFER